ncbi:hypothetical protein HGRIS_004103 [Hohenbuehelia grisea]|uniref:Uncharacterized protein n=1 Tax=Hohenbuehelia grisea TaxID=104357 RepID=A0ABR3JIF2_9AGAR
MLQLAAETHSEGQNLLASPLNRFMADMRRSNGRNTRCSGFRIPTHHANPQWISDSGDWRPSMFKVLAPPLASAHVSKPFQSAGLSQIDLRPTYHVALRCPVRNADCSPTVTIADALTRLQLCAASMGYWRI